MKFLKWAGIIVVTLGIVLFAAIQWMTSNTKKNSPEETIVQTINDTDFEIFYCRPYKKGRDIFGNLVPYGEVWRTGANEATTFSVSKPVNFGGKQLPAGKYTLWTIPGQDSWKVILNSQMYGWGVSFDGVASREKGFDVLGVDVPVQQTSSVVEQFTIKLVESTPTKLSLSWDNVLVEVPII